MAGTDRDSIGGGVRRRVVTAVPGMAPNAPRRNALVVYGYLFAAGVSLALLSH